MPQSQDQPLEPPIPAEGEPFSRADFVAFVRANHPDRGGDRETFEQGLARYRSARRGADRTGASEPDTSPDGDAPLIWVDPVDPVHRLVDRVRRRYRRHRRTRVR